MMSCTVTILLKSGRFARSCVVHWNLKAELKGMQSISESFTEFAQHNIEDAFRRIFAALTLDVVYGMSVSGPEDGFILRIELANELFGKMKLPGAFLADMIPMLQYIPAWCPGGAAQRFSQKYRPFFN